MRSTLMKKLFASLNLTLHQGLPKGIVNLPNMQYNYRSKQERHGPASQTHIHLKKCDNESKKIAIRVIKEELTGFGFYQNGKEWFLGSDEVVFVLALQKSSFDDILYFNVGIYICCLSVITKTPKERECHIRTRLENLFVHQIGRTPIQILMRTSRSLFEFF